MTLQHHISYQQYYSNYKDQHKAQYHSNDTPLYGWSILGHLLVGEGLPGLLRGILGLIELVSS